MRWLLSVGTGAVIGLAAALALELSFRFWHRPAGAAVSPQAPPLIVDPQGWPVKAAIVAFGIAFYTLVGYTHRPATPPAPAAEQALADGPPAPANDTGPVPLMIGDITLAFAPPAGNCLYPAPLLEAVKLQQAKLNPDNAIDTAFADCDQLKNSVANQTRIRDFGILMTPQTALKQRIDRAAIDQMAATMPDQTSVKATLDQRLVAAQSKLALQSFSALGAIDRDQQAIYFAYLAKAQGADGPYAQACVMAMTAINGRMVSYYLYSDYERDPRPVIFGLLQKVKAAVNDFAQRNPA
jgi:hypothetical protein